MQTLQLNVSMSALAAGTIDLYPFISLLVTLTEGHRASRKQNLSTSFSLVLIK